MTEREREAREVKQAESAEIRGTASRPTALAGSGKVGLKLPWAEGVEDALRSLSEAESDSVVQLVE
jgi:hypothetical protein